MKRAFRYGLTGFLVAAATAGCKSSSSPTEPGTPDPTGNSGDPQLAIDWDGRAVDWGAPEPLRATITDAPAGARVEWRSLDDFYLGQPVVLGTGAEITTAALKPGMTTVEAVVLDGTTQIARQTASIVVRYRDRWNVQLDGQLAFPAGTVGDVWIEAGNALVARRGEGGISIVSLTGGLQEIGRFNETGMFSQDVKSGGGAAYVAQEGAIHNASVVVVDISDPTAPVAIGRVLREETPSAHNVWVDGSRLYIASNGTGTIHQYDVSDPAAPTLVATMQVENGTAHDMHVRDGFVYASYLLFDGRDGGLVVGSTADMSRVATRQYEGAFTHSSWLSADGRTLYVADEVINAPIRIYDVSNPASPTLVGRYQPRVGTIPHQFHVVDNQRAYVAHYKHGVEVIDVSDPLAPRLIGFYDTFAGEQADAVFRSLAPSHHDDKDSQSIFDGAWGVHWLPDGRFVASDMASGLYLLRFTGGS